MTRIGGLAVALFLLGGFVGLQAKEPENPYVWKPSVRSVAVFKNGMGFFMREGKVALRDGWCMAETIPPAVFGTFAVCSLDPQRTVDVVGAGPGETVEFDGRDAPNDNEARRSRLRQCVGLQVSLTCGSADKPENVCGTLVEVTETLVVVKVKDSEQLRAAKLDDVTKLQLMQMPLRVHVDGSSKESESVSIGMAYLRKGITWIPEYTLEVIDDSTAILTLRGTLVNEAEDLVNADVHFVVGVPSFLHGEYLTPIAVGRAIRTVATAVPLQVMSQSLANNAIMARSDVAKDGRTTVNEAPAPKDSGNLEAITGGLPQMGGAGASDFAVYTKTGMTVRTGEKAIVTIFRKKVSYSHFYRWTSPGELKHYLVLPNDTDTPWTTGPVVAVSERRPLCEDLIRYTARGARCELPITTAVNIATDVQESEIDRKLKAHEPKHDVFLDLVAIEGRVRLVNREARPVRLAVCRTVPGMLKMASGDGRIQQDVSKLQLLERGGSVNWDVELKAGETAEFTYRYERYVASQ